MKELAQKLNALFWRREDETREVSQKSWIGSIGKVSHIARSIRETEKFQAHGGKVWRNALFFLMAAAFILFVLSYFQ